MQLFANALIALDLGYSVGFKKKSLLRKKIVEEGGIISYIVTRKCKYVVTSDPEKCDVSSKCRMAAKYNLPVLSLDFIWDSLDAGKVLPIDSYIVGGKSKILDFKSGKIGNSKQKDENKRSKKCFRFNPRNVKIWTFQDVNLPTFDEDGHVVAKYAFYTKMNTDDLDVIEVHAPPLPQERLVPEENEDLTEYFEFKYRITLQHGPKARLEEGHTCSKDIRYTKTAEEALAVFAMLCEDFNKKTDYVKIEAPVRNVGSHNLQKLVAKQSFTDGNFNKKVQDLVEHVWREAMTELSDCLGDVKKIKTDQLEKAEAILSKIRDSIKAAASENEISSLIDSFYDALPHKVQETHPNAKNCKQWLMKKQDMCQLIKDVISVNEITNFEMRSVIDAKYEALRCEICHLESKNNKRRFVEEQVISAIGDPECHITITNVFEVWRQVEDITFRHDLDNKQLLFHSSKVENYVGILSRGLLLPKVIVDEYGGKRSDIGLLGGGIYFASDPSTSIKYSTASRTKGTRLLLINEVALGKCQDFSAHRTDLVAAPEGFDSSHGVSKKKDPSSTFEDDEYVVYNVNQQRVRYLVEFKLEGDTVKPIDDMEEGFQLPSWDDRSQISMYDVKGVADPLTKVKSGLIGKGDQQVDLRGVHIRAKLIDLAAQVVVLQEYYNGSDESIEAKYVFPLDDAAAVCGFEAFINGKHIVGEVKEKETAHKEYKQAIKEGHGAYLMDQDEETPDVFTVSVGNLPAKACVLIKITYVAELQVEGELINFRLPASVAPWKEDAALKKQTQDDLSSHKVVGDQTSVQVSIEMPFEIRSLTCPTHNVKIKQTASKAYVEMFEGQEYGSGFQLLIGLAEIHVPRMWVERHPEDPNHRACMLTFYPEFEANESEAEIIIFLDCSNSMKESASVDAKKVALLLLTHLPSGSLFNVVRFGSVWEELFPASYAMSSENCQKAWEFVMNSFPERGNTNVIQPLHPIFLMPNSKFMRNVFLISDGHINDDEVILKSAFMNHDNVRIFTFGVSSTCNSFCLKAIARVSGGAFEFFNQATKSKWEPKVKDQISKARQPGLTSVSVKWEQHDDNLPPPTQAPKQITALYNGSRQVVYGFVPNCTMATLTANVGGQELSTLVSTSELGITDGLVVHRLSARAIIRDWEDGILSQDRTGHEVAKMDMKNFVIDLSKQYSIVTQLTSFIAVEKRDENEKDIENKGPTMEELVQRESVDILEYMGWTHEPAFENLPSGYLISTLTKSVKERYLPEKFNEKLAFVGEKCRRYLKNLELCSSDAFDVATTMMNAFDLKGEPQKAAEFGATFYEESINRLDEVSEEQRESVISRLQKFKKKINEFDSDVTLSPLPETMADDVTHADEQKEMNRTGDLDIRHLALTMSLECCALVGADELCDAFGEESWDTSSNSDESSDDSSEESSGDWSSELDNSIVQMSEPVPPEPQGLLVQKTLQAPMGALAQCFVEEESDSEMGFGLFDDLTPEEPMEQKAKPVPLYEEEETEADFEYCMFPVQRKGAVQRAPGLIDFDDDVVYGEMDEYCVVKDEQMKLMTADSTNNDFLMDCAKFASPSEDADAICLEEKKEMNKTDDLDIKPQRLLVQKTVQAPIGSFAKCVTDSDMECDLLDDLYDPAGNDDFLIDCVKFASPSEDADAICLEEQKEMNKTDDISPMSMRRFNEVHMDQEKADAQRPFQTNEARITGTGFAFGASSGAHERDGRSGFGSYQTTAMPSLGGMSATALSMPKEAPFSGLFGSTSTLPPPKLQSSAATSLGFGFGFGSPATHPLSSPGTAANAFGSPATHPLSSPGTAANAFGSPATHPLPSPGTAAAMFGSPVKPFGAPPPPPPAPAPPGFAAFGTFTKALFQPPQSLYKARRAPPPPPEDSGFAMPSRPPPPPPASGSYAEAPSRKTHGNVLEKLRSKDELPSIKKGFQSKVSEKIPFEPMSSMMSFDLSGGTLASRQPRSVSPPATDGVVMKSFEEERKPDAVLSALPPRTKQQQAKLYYSITESSRGDLQEKLDDRCSKLETALFFKKCKKKKEVAKELSTDMVNMAWKGPTQYLSSYHQREYTQNLEAKEREKPVEQKSSLSLAQFGIGTELGLVRQAGYRFKVSDIAAILALQNYNGSWEFSAKVDLLIGTNSKACLNILKTSGLYSLGKTTAQEVEMLVATLLVVVALFELLFPLYFPLDVSELHLAKLNSQDFDKDVVEKELTSAGLSKENITNLLAKMYLAFDFCHEIDQRHPLVYSTLELGHDWIFVAAAMMNVIKRDSI